MEHCQSCPVQLHCGSYFFGETVNESGKLDGQNLTKSYAVRRLFKEIGIYDTYKYLH